MNLLNLLYVFIIIVNLYSNTIECRMQDNQEDLGSYVADFGRPQIPLKFFKPIKYSLGSIKCFLKHTYNDRNYSEIFLPLNFDHMIDFLSHVDKTEEPRSYIKSVVKLFGQKLKSVKYINSFALIELLEKMILLSPYFESYVDSEKTISVIRSQLLDLLNMRESLSFDLDALSEDIYNFVLNQGGNQEISDLRYVIYQFLEIVLAKLIWSSIDQENCWESVKLIACQMEQIHQKNILTEEMLNDLYWTLILRFNYFLDISGTELNQSSYNEIFKDIENEDLALWALVEKEPYILSKRDCLKQVVISSAIAARACQEGIISNYI